MIALLRKLASLKLTLVTIAWLLLHAIVISRGSSSAIQWLIVPIAVMAMNLFAAILTNRAFRRQSALLVFHIGLLAVVLLIGAGALTRLEARVELVEGAEFNSSSAAVQNRGWLHPDELNRVRFVQGPIEIDYLQGLRRDTTRSDISTINHDGTVTPLRVGDQTSFHSNGYRFGATFNKGFALLLHWQSESGESRFGAINFPSFPEFEWNQKNVWQTPAREQLEFELELQALVDDSNPWTLSSEHVAYRVIVKDGQGAYRSLAEGDKLQVDAGTLSIAGLRLWMGYRIDFNPFLPWVLAAAFLSIAALAFHFQAKFFPLRRARTSVAALRSVRA